MQPIDCLLDKWDAAYRNLELAEARLVSGKNKTRPTNRMGCCGCRGVHEIIASIMQTQVMVEVMLAHTSLVS